MFKNIVKRPSCTLGLKIRPTRLARSFLNINRTEISSTPTRQFSDLGSTYVGNHGCRTYSTSADDASAQKPVEGSEMPPDAWVSILENTISSPWLAHRPPTPERILERAFTLILQILLSLNVPRDPEAAQAFFFAFENAPVSPDSEIGRGRRAIATLSRIIIDDISSIPASSPLRTAHPNVFALHGALAPLVDIHLREPSGDVEDWKAFWTRAETPLFELNTELHNSSFGMDLEELMKAAKEEK